MAAPRIRRIEIRVRQPRAEIGASGFRPYQVYHLAADGHLLTNQKFTLLADATAAADRIALGAGERAVVNEDGADLVVREVYSRTP